MPHLSLHPTLRTCSSDTILRGISELTAVNTTYTSETGKSYDFNTATKLNSLLVKVLKNTGQLVTGESYDLDFDLQFIETEKYDAKMTYKKFMGYCPGVAVIGELIVGIENRDGNANVRFHQQDTLERIFSNLEQNGIHIKRVRMDCGSCSREIVETVEKHSEHFYIRANRCASLYDSCASISFRQQKVLPSGRGLPLTSNTFGALPPGQVLGNWSSPSAISPTDAAFDSIAVIGVAMAAPAVARAAFFMNVLLSIV